jgi:RNA recognition motif-containing protein
VTLYDPSKIDEVLKSQPHIIDGKAVDCKIAIPKDHIANVQEIPSEEANGLQKSRKIFVGGLPPNLEECEMRAYFEKFGELEQCVVMKDKPTGKSRGFGFVLYVKEESADVVMNMKTNHNIHGKWVILA